MIATIALEEVVDSSNQRNNEAIDRIRNFIHGELDRIVQLSTGELQAHKSWVKPTYVRGHRRRGYYRSYYQFMGRPKPKTFNIKVKLEPAHDM